MVVEQLDELYREVILDHFRQPRNQGQLPDAQIKAEGVNPLCGDEITVWLKLNDGRIQDAHFLGKGCAISQAAASMLTEELKGKSLEDVRQFTKEQMLDLLGVDVNPMRLKCALLALKIVKIGAYGATAWAEDEA